MTSIDANRRSYARRLVAVATSGLSLALASQVHAQSAPSPEESSDQLEEVVVTGTLIRGIAPAGANVIGVSKDQMQAIGATNTNELMKYIPQVTSFFSIEQPLAAAQFQQINRPTIRNLETLISSTNTTLILLDGRRMVNAGIKQNAPDPDVVPPGVIERVEVLPDGGSATYGTDAIGGVINFITKRRFDGVEADARVGFASDYQTFDANGVIGRDWGSGSAWLSYNFAETDGVYGRDRDWVRRFSTTGSLNPDLTCSPGNVIIRQGLTQTTYAIPDLQPNTVNGCDTSDDQTIFPHNERHSTMVGFSQDVTDSITFDLRGYYTRREVTFYNTPRSTGAITAANPYYRRTADNQTGAPLPQSVSFSWEPVLGRSSSISGRTILKSGGVTPTATINLGDWQVRAMANLGKSENLADSANAINGTLLRQALSGTTMATALNPYDLAATDPAVLESITNWGAYAFGEQEMTNYRVIADGKVGSLPGGDLRLAAGVEYLRETYKAKQQSLTAPGAGPSLPFHPGASRTNKSVFVELAIPVFGADNRFTGMESLDLSLSGRYDDYSDFGGIFNPKIAFSYEPVSWLKIRGNYGESFNAPGLADSAEGAVDSNVLLVTAALLPNPLPGQFTAAQAQWPVVVLQGGVKGTEPQTAKTYQIGFDLTPALLPGSKFSLTYYSIDFKNVIGIPPAQRLLDLYTHYGQYYTMNPTQDQVLAAAAQVPGGLDRVAPLLGPGALPIYNLLDARRRNLGRVKVSGLDFSINYAYPASFGSIDASFSGNYDLQKDNQPVAGTPFIDMLESDANRLRTQALLAANIGELRAQLTWSHRHGYDITPTVANNLQTKADSFDVFDLFFRYDLSNRGGLFEDLAVSLAVNNFLDQDAPLYRGTSQTTQGHGYVNGFHVGRLFQIGVNKRL